MYSLKEMIRMNNQADRLNTENCKPIKVKWASGLKAKNEAEVIDLTKLTHEEKQKKLNELFEGR